MSGLEEEYYVNEIFNHQDFNSSYGTDGFLYAVNKFTGETFVLVDQQWLEYETFCEISFLTHQDI